MAGVREKCDPSRGAGRGRRAAGRGGRDVLRDCADDERWRLERTGDDRPSGTATCSRRGRGHTPRRRRRDGCTGDSFSGGGAGPRRRSARGDLRLDNEPEPWHNSRDWLGLSELGAVTRVRWANRALTPRLSPLPTLPERSADRQRRGRGRRRSHGRKERAHRSLEQRPQPSSSSTSRSTREDRCPSRAHRRVSRICHFLAIVDTDARSLRGADRGVRSRWRHLAGDQGDHRKRGPAAHGRREPAPGVARAGAGSGAVPVLQPRRCRHRAPAGDYWPAPAFRGLHELERRRGLRLHAALLQRLRHRHAGGGPRRALRVLRPVLPLEAARRLLPAPETYGCTASEAHGEAFLGLLAVRRGRRLRPHAAHRLNPGHLR